MAILDKIKKVLKSKNKSEIIFLHNGYKEYALYFKESKNKYIFVGDSDFPYGEESIDKKWLSMNKHNFKYYEEFKSLPQLINRYNEVQKNLKNTKTEEKIDYIKEDCKILPNGWYWKTFDDYSGSLKSPNGEIYFAYDWTSREYKIKENDSYSYFDTINESGEKQTFKDFKNFAEMYVKENLLKVEEKNVESIENKVKKAQEKVSKQVLKDKVKSKNKSLQSEV